MLSDEELEYLAAFARGRAAEFPSVGRRVMQLLDEHRALKRAVVAGLDRVGNLRVVCPELARLVGAEEGG